MKILELFSGTASFSRVCKERKHQTFTIDNNPIFKPDLCIDIMELDWENEIPFVPDVIWASPPCQKFSIMTVYKNWKKEKDGTFTPKDIYISYFRYPQYIDKEGYIKFDGSPSVNQNCELEAYLEDEILDIAIQNLAMYTENQSAVQNAQVRIQTNE